MLTGDALLQGLLDRGFNRAQAAALVGNMKQESEFRPGVVNPGEGAQGLIQWRQDRLTGLKNFAAQNGQDYTDPNAQLDFIVHEMTGPEAKNSQAFLKATDVQSANAALKKYIRYGDNTQPVRLQNALAYAGDSTGNPAVNAVNAEAASAPANPVRTVSFVPPPFSNQQGNFQPLLDDQPAAAPQSAALPAVERAPLPPVAAPDTNSDPLKAWGVDTEETAPDQSQTPAAPEQDILKAWGVDSGEPTPAGDIAKSQSAKPDTRDNVRIDNVIRQSMGLTPLPVPEDASSTAEDVVKAGASGLARGAADLIGLPGTIANGMNAGGNWLLRNGYKAVTGSDPAPGTFFGGPTEAIKQSMLFGGGNPLSGSVLKGALSGATSGATDYQARTVPGQYAGTIGEFIPGAAVGGGTLGNIVKYGVAPAVASETAGQLTKGTALEPWARAAGALATPFGIDAAGYGVNKLVNAAGSVTPKGSAATNLLAATKEAGTTPGAIAAEIARNPRLSPMDVDPNLQQMAMNLANQGGAPRAVLNQAVESRMAGSKDAVQGAFDSTLGKTPDVAAYLEGLKQTARVNAQKGFGDALNGAKPVNIQPVLDSIDAKVSPGIAAITSPGSKIPLGPVEQTLANLRSTLANPNEVLSDATRLHQIQSDLRVQAQALSSSSSGQERLIGSALNGVRQKLIGALDDATGGKFSIAQKQYADDMSIQDAFDKGRQILSNGTSSDAALYNRPEFWKAWVGGASQPELQAAKLGARVAIDNQINSVRAAAAKGAAVPDVGFNRDRLEIILGKAETDKLAQALSDEQKIASTNAKLFAGSQTAPRQAVNKLTNVTEINSPIRADLPLNATAGFAVAGLPGAAAGVGLSLAKRGGQYLFQQRDLARNKLLAQALSGDAATFNQGVAPALLRNRLLQAAKLAPSGTTGYLGPVNALIGRQTGSSQQR